jgi:D-xylose transport system permease protein
MKARTLLKNFAMPLALLAIFAFFTVWLDWDALLRRPDASFVFLSSRNLSHLLVEFSNTAVLALGMFMIILTGNIDLSVGSGAGLIGGIGAILITQQGWSAPMAMLAGLGVALTLWFLMGTLIVKQRIPSFIITLGGMQIFKGLFWRVINNSTIDVRPGGRDNLFSEIASYSLPAGRGELLGVAAFAIYGWILWRARRTRAAHGVAVEPWRHAALKWGFAALAGYVVVRVCNDFHGLPATLLILAATAVVVYFLTQHTPFGRYLYAIGGNEEAAVLSGINVDRVIIGAFVFMGATVALTGYMITAYQGSSSTTVGGLMELDAIAACVIGGTALKGGRGTVWGVLFGALIMTSLLNGMTLIPVEEWVNYVARGTVLVLAVWLDVRLGRD